MVPLQNRPGSHLEWFQLTRDSDFTALEVDHLEEMQQVFFRFRRSLTRRQDALRAAGLTPREREVLALVGQGLTTGAVADRLGCAPATARKHVEHLHAKLMTHDRVSLVMAGQQLGVIPAPAT